MKNKKPILNVGDICWFHFGYDSGLGGKAARITSISKNKERGRVVGTVKVFEQTECDTMHENDLLVYLDDLWTKTDLKGLEETTRNRLSRLDLYEDNSFSEDICTHSNISSEYKYCPFCGEKI